MNELLQKHGCSNVFSVPEGLRELMADITREVLREQPEQIYDFITNYLSALLITREHGLMAVKILDDLCDCRPSVSEHLLQAGIPNDKCHMLSEVIQAELEGYSPETGKETVKESEIVKKVLQFVDMDEETTAKVCQVTRNAFRDYTYRKQVLEKRLKETPDEPWERAAENTLRIYKTTKPSFAEISRAAQVIQAAYRGYHVRRQMLSHLSQPFPDRFEAPVDVAGSREIDLGPMLAVDPSVEDHMEELFEEVEGKVRQSSMWAESGIKMITHIKSKHSHIIGNTSSSTMDRHDQQRGREHNDGDVIDDVDDDRSSIRSQSLVKDEDDHYDH